MLLLGKTKNKTQSLQLVSEYDFYSFTESVHYHAHKFLGVQEKTVNGVTGILFTLWAPKAKAVSVVGDFNNWRINANPMQRAASKENTKSYVNAMSDGLWNLWMPKLQPDFAYQFALHFDDKRIEYIQDPFAKELRFLEHRLACIFKTTNYKWSDQEWINKRESEELSTKAISILSLDLVQEALAHNSYQAFAKFLVQQAKQVGSTHILLSSLIEEIVDLTELENNIIRERYYFSARHDLGSSDDLRCLIDYLHANGIGMILDLPVLQQSYDYHKKSAANLLISSVIYWLEEFHIDGFRFSAKADASSQGLSFKNDDLIDFIKVLNESVHARSKGAITIIEDDGALPGITKPAYLGGLGFNLSISKHFTNHIKSFISLGQIDTSCSVSSFAENRIISLDDCDLRSLDQDTLKILIAYFFIYPGKKLIDIELLKQINALNKPNTFLEDFFFTSVCRFLDLDWEDDKLDVFEYIQDLNYLYADQAAFSGTDLKDTCFEWVDYQNKDLVSFLRWSREYDELVLVVINLSAQDISHYAVGVPQPGLYLQIFSSNAIHYAGSGLGNDDGLYSSHNPVASRPYSLVMDIAAKSLAIFKLQQ